MVITMAHVPAIVALIAGILILIMPRLLNFIVAIYLIIIGLVGLGLLRCFTSSGPTPTFASHLGAMFANVGVRGPLASYCC